MEIFMKLLLNCWIMYFFQLIQFVVDSLLPVLDPSLPFRTLANILFHIVSILENTIKICTPSYALQRLRTLHYNFILLCLTIITCFIPFINELSNKNYINNNSRCLRVSIGIMLNKLGKICRLIALWPLVKHLFVIILCKFDFIVGSACSLL